jgi:hypothetical protein
LIKMRVPDGAPESVVLLSGYHRGATWGANDTILISTTAGNQLGLHTVSASGGKPTVLEMSGLSGGSFLFPSFLPNGEDFLFHWVSQERPDDAAVYLATLRNGRLIRGPIFLRKNVTAARYTPYAGGRLLFVQNDKFVRPAS